MRGKNPYSVRKCEVRGSAMIMRKEDFSPKRRARKHVSYKCVEWSRQ